MQCNEILHPNGIRKMQTVLYPRLIRLKLACVHTVKGMLGEQDSCDVDHEQQLEGVLRLSRNGALSLCIADLCRQMIRREIPKDYIHVE